MLALTVGFTFSSMAQSGQEALAPKASPLDMARTFIGETYVNIVYSRPHKKDREIFGGLVPYGEVWRLGANAATEITTTGDLNFGGQTLEAGTYSLYAIPMEDKWTIIVNSAVGQWGAYRYDQEKDVMRFDVETETLETPYEAFSIAIEGEGATRTLSMMWDQTKVSFEVSQ